MSTTDIFLFILRTFVRDKVENLTSRSKARRLLFHEHVMIIIPRERDMEESATREGQKTKWENEVDHRDN